MYSADSLVYRPQQVFAYPLWARLVCCLQVTVQTVITDVALYSTTTTTLLVIIHTIGRFHSTFSLGNCITMLPADWSISTSHDPFALQYLWRKMLWNLSIAV